MNRICALLAVVSVLFCASCTDGNGGPPVRFVFGMENRGECEAITVESQLAFAQTGIVKRFDGAPDCELDPLLEAAGCHAEFSMTDGDASLVAHVTGCDFYETALFSCLLRNPDTARLNMGTHGHCTCASILECNPAHATCYRDPGICVTANPTGRGCEHCSNDLDDDGDGKTDCNDEKCWLDCGVGLTTTSCSPSTSATTTLPTTSTSMEILKVEELVPRLDQDVQP